MLWGPIDRLEQRVVRWDKPVSRLGDRSYRLRWWLLTRGFASP